MAEKNRIEPISLKTVGTRKTIQWGIEAWNMMPKDMCWR